LTNCTKCQKPSEKITKVYGKPYCLDCGKKKRASIANANRKEREQCYKDLGLKKVKGALGGTYWE